MRAVAVLIAIERIVVRAWHLRAGVGIPGEIVAAHDFFRGKRAGLDACRIVFRVVRHITTAAKHRVVVVDAGVDDADAHPFASGREIAATPNVGRPDERDTCRGQRPELSHRLDVDHAGKPPQSLHLAKRQPHLQRVGQAAEPRLDHPADLAKPCHERVLLSGDFGDASASDFGDLALGQALGAKPHGDVRRRFTGEFRINQARFHRLFSRERLAKPCQAKANRKKNLAPSKAKRHARKMPVFDNRSEPPVGRDEFHLVPNQ